MHRELLCEHGTCMRYLVIYTFKEHITMFGFFLNHLNVANCNFMVKRSSYKMINPNLTLLLVMFVTVIVQTCFITRWAKECVISRLTLLN